MSFVSGRGQANAFVNRSFLSFSSFVLATMVGIVSSFTFSTAYDMARKALFDEQQEIAGVWHGEWHGVPAVTIHLEEQDGALKGTAEFYTIFATAAGPKRVGQTGELQLINPRFNGKKLSFEVQSSDIIYPVITAQMEMSFVGEGRAELRPTGQPPGSRPENQETTINMKRTR